MPVGRVRTRLIEPAVPSGPAIESLLHGGRGARSHRVPSQAKPGHRGATACRHHRRMQSVQVPHGPRREPQPPCPRRGGTVPKRADRSVSGWPPERGSVPTGSAPGRPCQAAPSRGARQGIARSERCRRAGRIPGTGFHRGTAVGACPSGFAAITPRHPVSSPSVTEPTPGRARALSAASVQAAPNCVAGAGRTHTASRQGEAASS